MKLKLAGALLVMGSLVQTGSVVQGAMSREVPISDGAEAVTVVSISFTPSRHETPPLPQPPTIPFDPPSWVDVGSRIEFDAHSPFIFSPNTVYDLNISNSAGRTDLRFTVANPASSILIGPVAVGGCFEFPGQPWGCAGKPLKGSATMTQESGAGSTSIGTYPYSGRIGVQGQRLVSVPDPLLINMSPIVPQMLGGSAGRHR